MYADSKQDFMGHIIVISVLITVNYYNVFIFLVHLLEHLCTFDIGL